MLRSADISSDGLYRWRLERRWGEGLSVCWIMLNPSTADAEKDDPTIRRVMAFSKRWGYDAAVVVNLWPFRSSSPVACKEWATPMVCAVRSRRRLLGDAMLPNTGTVWREALRADITVAAWGTAAWCREYAGDLTASLHLQNIELYCLGTNADGSPKHPLARGRARVPDSQEPLVFAKHCALLAGREEE